MKYRIKDIRRAGWVETEDNLFRPAEDVAPVIPSDPDLEDSAVYIIPDEDADKTVIFTPPTPPLYEEPIRRPAPPAPTPFFRTTEGKIVIGVSAALLVIFILLIAILLSPITNKPDTPATESTSSHTHVWVVDEEGSSPATCTTDGYRREKCSICNMPNGEVSIPKLGHDLVYPSCTDEGTLMITCKNEGCDYQEITHDVQHDFKLVDTVNNKTYYKCTRCGQTKTETLDCDHEWKINEELSTPPTCLEAGTNYKYCIKCGDEETEPAEATGHDYDPEKTETIAPTCLEKGKTLNYCKLCNQTIEEETEDEQPPHEIEPATCSAGETCKVCGTVFGDPLEHTFEDGICSVCGFTEEPDPEPQDVELGESITLDCGSTLKFSFDGTASDEALTVTATLNATSSYDPSLLTAQHFEVLCPGGSSKALLDVPDGFLTSSGDYTIALSNEGPGTYVIMIHYLTVTHTCTFPVEEK